MLTSSCSQHILTCILYKLKYIPDITEAVYYSCFFFFLQQVFSMVMKPITIFGTMDPRNLSDNYYVNIIVMYALVLADFVPLDNFS